MSDARLTEGALLRVTRLARLNAEEEQRANEIRAAFHRAVRDAAARTTYVAVAKAAGKSKSWVGVVCNDEEDDK